MTSGTASKRSSAGRASRTPPDRHAALRLGSRLRRKAGPLHAVARPIGRFHYRRMAARLTIRGSPAAALGAAVRKSANRKGMMPCLLHVRLVFGAVCLSNRRASGSRSNTCPAISRPRCPPLPIPSMSRAGLPTGRCSATAPTRPSRSMADNPWVTARSRGASTCAWRKPQPLKKPRPGRLPTP